MSAFTFDVKLTPKQAYDISLILLKLAKEVNVASTERSINAFNGHTFYVDPMSSMYFDVFSNVG